MRQEMKHLLPEATTEVWRMMPPYRNASIKTLVEHTAHTLCISHATMCFNEKEYDESEQDPAA